MKTLFLAVAMLAAQTAKANPYFRFAALHPTPVGGVLLSAEDLKQSEATGLHPIFSHSMADGCILPSVVCEDWSPLAVGFSLNGGDLSFVVGPIANVLPWMQNAALQLIPDRYYNLRALFAPAQAEQPITFSMGPMWEYKQSQNKGYYRTFVGAALHF